MAEGRLVFDGSGSDLSSDIVEKIYGMQVNRTANYRSRQQAIHQNDTRLDEFETEANTIALFKGEKMSTRLKRRSQAL
jgi:ABC-type phosphate/phosphonate transport system ATPase subunit